MQRIQILKEKEKKKLGDTEQMNTEHNEYS